MAKQVVVVETPRGSSAKFAFDPERRVFVLKRVLPAGMVLPYDFGYVPGTRAEDGDPLDVIVVSETVTFPGCEIECRIVGALTAKQREKGGEVRNDRLLAVPCSSRAFAQVNELDDFPSQLLEDLEQFFKNYHAIVGAPFSPLERLGAARARELIDQNRHG